MSSCNFFYFYLQESWINSWSYIFSVYVYIHHTYSQVVENRRRKKKQTKIWNILFVVVCGNSIFKIYVHAEENYAKPNRKHLKHFEMYNKITGYFGKRIHTHDTLKWNEMLSIHYTWRIYYIPFLSLVCVYMLCTFYPQ